MQTTLNVRYAKPARCVLDVYSPTYASDSPVVIVLHGGAWFLGDKIIAKSMSENLALRGCVVVTPGYRLSNVSNDNVTSVMGVQSFLLLLIAVLATENARALLFLLVIFLNVLLLTYLISKPRQVIHHPVHANDVAEAVRWTVDNIAQHGGNPNHIVLLGHSAGGHLASLVSCNPKFLRRVDLPATAIKGTVCISGVFSDRRLMQTPIGHEILKNAFGNRKSYVDAFPIYHVQPNTPPHFLLNANLDYSLKRHTLDMFFALRARGIYVRSQVYPNTTHFNIRHRWEHENKRILLDIVQFIHEVVEYVQHGPKLINF